MAAPPPTALHTATQCRQQGQTRGTIIHGPGSSIWGTAKNTTGGGGAEPACHARLTQALYAMAQRAALSLGGGQVRGVWRGQTRSR